MTNKRKIEEIGKYSEVELKELIEDNSLCKSCFKLGIQKTQEEMKEKIEKSKISAFYKSEDYKNGFNDCIDFIINELFQNQNNSSQKQIKSNKGAVATTRLKVRPDNANPRKRKEKRKMKLKN